MTKQEQFWKNEFGDEYVDRNPMNSLQLDALYFKKYGITRSVMNYNFLKDLQIASVFEVGCSTGAQLLSLIPLGFTSLFGLDINAKAIRYANLQGVAAFIGSALDLPFKDDSFEMVFTSGLLIHIDPSDLPKVMNEIIRVSKRYIWGFEYFSKNKEPIKYRENDNVLWKGNFREEYQALAPLSLVKEEFYPYSASSIAPARKLQDTMFLLEKI